ncbi:signal recognition particle 9 kDa protein isoform X1 [Salvia miltiorrhiza]|uniref:signal recognition particle 9 kDa protein isoform X1 n=1 Tax=Salvia miltiorrhiza TaxID=226208 RepID=UPI0025AC54B4|nr:signal recognition particle 9 kDa protein isoform X1 [Salvia miltiorrhiza]
MVYIESWDDFVEKSVQLFRSDPEKTRYAMKYRHCDGKLVLKVTDDRECIKFKTDQAQDAKKMEKFNNIFFTLMARGPDGIVLTHYFSSVYAFHFHLNVRKQTRGVHCYLAAFI